MELRRSLGALRSRWPLVLACLLAAGVVAGLVTPRAHRYSATTIVYVGASKFSLSPGSSYAYDPTQLVARLMQTYAVMLQSETIAADAVHSGGFARDPKKVVKEIHVIPGKDDQLLRVTVVDPDPAVSQGLANGVADAFLRRAKAFDGAPGPGALPSLPAYVFQRADLPDHPVGTGLARNVALAAFFGLLAGLGLALLLERLDQSLTDVASAEEQLGLPVLAALPFSAAQASGARDLVAMVSVERGSHAPRAEVGA